MRFRIVLGIALAVALVAGLGYAQTGGPTAAVRQQQRTLHYKVKAVAVNQNDVAPPGTSIGDQVTSWSELRKTGSVVGHTGGNCTFAGSRAICTAIVIIDGQGQLSLAGRLQPAYLAGSGVARFAVNGGTGSYANVSGWATVEKTGAPTQDLTLHLAL